MKKYIIILFSLLSLSVNAQMLQGMYREREDPFIFQITASSFTLPLMNGYTYNFTVSWGDGSALSKVTSYNDANATHTYAGSGNYIISIKGTCQYVNFEDFNSGSEKLKLTKLVSFGNVGFTSFTNSYFGCTNLTGTIPSFSGCILVTNFYASFNGCTGLTGSIPSFSMCTLVNSFYDTFQGCTGLTGSIPSFPDNHLVVTFYAMFYGCTGLSGNAPNLWVTFPTAVGNYCFYPGTQFSNNASIPAGWK